MERLWHMYEDYKELVQYRKGRFEVRFLRESLRKLFTLVVIIWLGLAVDFAVTFFVGRHMTEKVFGLGTLLVALFASGAMILKALSKEGSPRAFKLMWWGIFSVIFIGAAHLIHMEMESSGSLYVYAIAILIFGTLINMPFQWSVVIFTLLDGFVIMEIGRQPMVHQEFFSTMKFIQPYHYILFCTVVALVSALNSSMQYLLLARERVHMDHVSETDPLTGLLNRRGMEKEIQRHRVFHNNACAVLFDVDNFKSYNDTYGHTAGDECLIKVAEILKLMASGHDALAVRFGGEEMLLIFFTDDVNKVCRIVDEGMKQLRAMKLRSGKAALLPYLTVSAGISVSKYPPGRNNDSYDKLVAKADEKLYEAKKRGKNQYVA